MYLKNLNLSNDHNNLITMTLMTVMIRMKMMKNLIAHQIKTSVCFVGSLTNLRYPLPPNHIPKQQNNVFPRAAIDGFVDQLKHPVNNDNRSTFYTNLISSSSSSLTLALIFFPFFSKIFFFNLFSLLSFY